MNTLSRPRSHRRLMLVAASCGVAVLAAACGQISVASSGSSTSAATSSSTAASSSSAQAPESSPAPAAPPAASPSEPAPGQPAPGEPAPPPPGAPAPPAPQRNVDPGQVENFNGLIDSLGAKMPEGTDSVQVVNQACDMLDQNKPVVEVNDFVAGKGQYDQNKAALFLGAGIPVFCPANTQKMIG